MNRFGLRTPALTAAFAAAGLATAVVLTGCGAGQVSQTATQEPAVNGTSAIGKDITLRNVHLRAAQSTDYVQPGSDAELLFAAVNSSPEEGDKLLSITSEYGTVALSGNGNLAPSGTLIVGTPDGQIAALETAEDADSAKAEVTLTKPISNGLTYPFTFTFQRAGDIDVNVPISAGEAPRRDKSGQSSDHGGEGGH